MTSLIVGDDGSRHERQVAALAAGTVGGVLFTDDVRCPVHVVDLASGSNLNLLVSGVEVAVKPRHSRIRCERCRRRPNVGN